MSLALQEYGWTLASTWQCKVAHKLEDLGIHFKIWWEVLPHPPYSTNLAPSDLHLFRALKDAICDTKYEAWWCDSPSENLATWPGQGMVLTRHAHTSFSLAQGRISGCRHCRKIGYGAIPSFFLICNFYDLEVNIYLETKGRLHFLGSPCTWAHVRVEDEAVSLLKSHGCCCNFIWMEVSTYLYIVALFLDLLWYILLNAFFFVTRWR